MARVIDISDKLAFDENPKISINGKEYEINADAETMLKVMGAVGSGDDTKVMQALGMIFKKGDLEAISKLKMDGKKLSGKAFVNILYAALDVVMGDSTGE